MKNGKNTKLRFYLFLAVFLTTKVCTINLCGVKLRHKTPIFPLLNWTFDKVKLNLSLPPFKNINIIISEKD